MTKPPAGTRHRIQEVARDLFAQKGGVQRTSLQDIADRLGITKPALYYHFRSREDLVRSILQPLIDEGEAFVADQERRSGGRATPRELLEGYFDFHFKHRADLLLVVSELTTLADLGSSTFFWRGESGWVAWCSGVVRLSSRKPAPSSHSADYRTAACSFPTPPRTRNSGGRP